MAAVGTAGGGGGTETRSTGVGVAAPEPARADDAVASSAPDQITAIATAEGGYISGSTMSTASA